jgi:DNA mismatch repair protein MutS2
MKSELGLNYLNSLQFCVDIKQLESRQTLLREWINFCDSNNIVWTTSVTPVLSMLRSAKKSGLLAGEELLKVRDFLTLEARLREQLTVAQKVYSSFSAITRKMREFSSEITALSVIEDSGRLSDSASQKLRELRESAGVVKRNARISGQKLMEDDKILNMLQERALAFRDGRYLLLVKHENINRFPGLFVDRSSSGNSVYMEPNALTQLNNKISILAREENEEERRILASLTRQLLVREGAIEEAESSLGEIDLLCSADEVRSKYRWNIPIIKPQILFKLFDARHPLLKERATPVDVSCGGEAFRQLIITGPNTGGKTVALKIAAVCIAAAWLGLPIPASEGSVVGAIDSIYADIGDEQSIEQNLSTFSAHLKNIISILKEADSHSLLLLDELGAGTDPQEGGALGVAILEELRVANKSLVLATTHHNPIKQYALTTSGVETASMEFNPETFSPTYRLLIGIPGRSNALHIAGAFGMPRKVIENAKKTLSEHEITSEEIVAGIHERGRLLEMRERELRDREKQSEKLKADYQQRLWEIEKRRDEIYSAADKRAASIIYEAEEKSKAMIKGLEGAVKSAAHKEINSRHDEVAKLRRLIENRYKKRNERLIEAARREQALKNSPFVPSEGMTVQVADSGMVGVIESIKNDRAQLIAGSMKLNVSLDNLLPTSKKAKVAEPVVDTSGAIRYERVPSSLMVRGMNVGEALPLVASYLDRAMRAGYSSVLVVHGRGEGILRREIHSLCASLKYVSDYRLGDAGEGGYGVTVVSFKR